MPPPLSRLLSFLRLSSSSLASSAVNKIKKLAIISYSQQQTLAKRDIHASNDYRYFLEWFI
jgi:hypothetical protein